MASLTSVSVSVSMSATTGATLSVASPTAPAQGSFDSAGAGVTGGYTGDSLSLKIIIAFFIGLALYNAIELIVLVLVTFNKYRGLYFWSLVISSIGIMPYALGFLIKFFQLLDPGKDEGYVAVVMLVLGWYMMVTGQSVVLWSRLHLLTNSQRVIKWSLYMICTDVVILGFPTSMLTFGSNSNSLTDTTLRRFVRGYNVMEKIQMVGFFVQELIFSLIYIKETVRILRLSKSAQGDIMSITDDDNASLKHPFARKVMYQLLAINSIIIAMDIALLAVEFANLYLIETTLKGVVYSVKLKLEFAVLGKLVQIVRSKADSSGQASDERQPTTSTGMELEKARSGSGSNGNGSRGASTALASTRTQMSFPDFVDPRRLSGDVTHAAPNPPAPARTVSSLSTTVEEEHAWEVEGQHRKRWHSSANRNSWIDAEMDRHNIG